MAQKGKYPSLERQWRKLMYAFYDYLPMQYKNASARDWQIRHLVWDFKDGRAYESVAEITASALVRFFGKETRNIVFACVPASSAAKNEKRYRKFAEKVCGLSGAINAYDHIRIEGNRLGVHERFDEKSIRNVQVIDFDKEFFNGKKVLVFDDVLTKGFSYARFALQLEKFGAEILGGFFLGKTIFHSN